MSEQEITVSAENSLTGFDPITSSIAALKTKYGKCAHDAKTTDGLKALKEERAELKDYRLQVEATREALKKPHLEAGREIDAYAKQLTVELTALETARDNAIKAEEKRKREEKEKREKAERERIAAEERQRNAEREAELQRENEKLRAQLAAAQAAAPAPEPEFKGWQTIEGGFESASSETTTATETPKANGVPAAHDPDLMDLAGFADFKPAFKVAQVDVAPRGRMATFRAQTSDNLPTAQQVSDALTAHAKQRTNIRNVVDVLEAIRAVWTNA